MSWGNVNVSMKPTSWHTYDRICRNHNRLFRFSLLVRSGICHTNRFYLASKLWFFGIFSILFNWCSISTTSVVVLSLMKAGNQLVNRIEKIANMVLFYLGRNYRCSSVMVDVTVASPIFSVVIVKSPKWSPFTQSRQPKRTTLSNFA